MKKPRWLLVEFVVAVNKTTLAEHGGSEGIREMEMLESAMARPINKLAYESKSTIFDLAAAYSFGIAMNHPFVDGNKRTALIAGLVFLKTNGINFKADEAETTLVFEDLAAGKLSEVELSRWYKDNQT